MKKPRVFRLLPDESIKVDGGDVYDAVSKFLDVNLLKTSFSIRRIDSTLEEDLFNKRTSTKEERFWDAIVSRYSLEKEYVALSNASSRKPNEKADF